MTVVKSEIDILKATDISTDSEYSAVLDYSFEKFKQFVYEQYARVIAAFSFINNDALFDNSDSHEIKKREDISTKVQEYIECFKGSWKGIAILNEKEYKIVLAATTAFIKTRNIPSIQKRVNIAPGVKEFVKKTYHRLYKKFGGDGIEWVNLLSALFEQFPHDEITSTYSNFARYGEKKYEQDKANIEM